MKILARKVVFVNRFFFPDHSATSQLLSDLAFYLGSRDFEVIVVTSQLLYDHRETRLPCREYLNGVEVYRVWTSRFGRNFILGRIIDYLTFYVSAWWRLFRILRIGDIVVAKTDPPLISVIIAWPVRWRKACLINWLQDLFPEVAEKLGVPGFSGLFGQWLKRLRNQSLRGGALNVVLGDRMRERVAQQGVPPELIWMIPNWADGDSVKPIPKSENPLRKKWNLEHRFVVGYSGNLGMAHEYETILSAAECFQDDTHLVFLFIGGGAQFEKLRTDVEERKLGNIQFRPYQPREQLQLSLSLCDVCLAVLRPEMEGLIVPSKFYGIAAAGRPTIFIGAEDGEIPQVLRETTSGVTVAVGDVDGLVKVIRRMKNESDWREQLGCNARRCFEERYDKLIAFITWEGALRQVMGEADCHWNR